MDKRLKILIYLLLIPVVLVVLFYGGFVALLIFTDTASYNGHEIYVGPIDYSSVLTNAARAGYEVSDQWAQMNKTYTIEPGNIEALDKRFNTDYIVDRFTLNYNDSAYLEFHKNGGSGTDILIYSSGISRNNMPLEPEIPDEDLKVKEGTDTREKDQILEPSGSPDDMWILEMLELVFRMDETRAQKLLERLKLQSNQDYWDVQISTNESVDFPAVYAYLNKTSTKTVFNSGISNNEEFYKDGKKIGYVSYIVPATAITTSHHFNIYNVYVSSSGYVDAYILMHYASSGRKIPEEEYRTVFKDMFKNLGLPPEKVDEMEFEYSPSVW